MEKRIKRRNEPREVLKRFPGEEAEKGGSGVKPNKNDIGF
jgi:hypothetical protein